MPDFSDTQLETKNLRLISTTTDDIADIFLRTVFLDKQGYFYPAFESYQECEDKINDDILKMKNGTKVELSIFSKTVGELAGRVDLYFEPLIDHQSAIIIDKNEWSVGISIFRNYQNKGLATEALRVLLNFGFENIPNLEKVFYTVDLATNLASFKLAKKLEFASLEANERVFVMGKKKI